MNPSMDKKRWFRGPHSDLRRPPKADAPASGPKHPALITHAKGLEKDGSRRTQKSQFKGMNPSMDKKRWFRGPHSDLRRPPKADAAASGPKHPALVTHAKVTHAKGLEKDGSRRTQKSQFKGMNPSMDKKR